MFYGTDCDPCADAPWKVADKHDLSSLRLLGTVANQ